MPGPTHSGDVRVLCAPSLAQVRARLPAVRRSRRAGGSCVGRRRPRRSPDPAAHHRSGNREGRLPGHLRRSRMARRRGGRRRRGELPQGVLLGKGEPWLGVSDAQPDLRQAAAAELRLPRPRADRAADHASDVRRRPGARLRGRRAGAGGLVRGDARRCRGAAVQDERAAGRHRDARGTGDDSRSGRLRPPARADVPRTPAEARSAQHGASGERRRRPRGSRLRPRGVRDRTLPARQRRPARAGTVGAPHGRQRVPAPVLGGNHRGRHRDRGRRGPDHRRHPDRRRARRVLQLHLLAAEPAADTRLRRDGHRAGIGIRGASLRGARRFRRRRREPRRDASCRA